MKHTLILVFSLILSLQASKSEEIIWEKEIPVQSPMQFVSNDGMKELKDGSIIWFYSLVDSTANHCMPGLIKTDSEGNIIWKFIKTYTKKVNPNFIIEEDNGDILVYCNWVRVFDMGLEMDFRPLIMRLDKDGNFIDDLCDSNISVKRNFDNGFFVLSDDNRIVDFAFNYASKKNYLYYTLWESNTKFISRSILDSISYTDSILKDKRCYITDAYCTADKGYILKIQSYSINYSQNYNSTLLKLDENFNRIWELNFLIRIPFAIFLRK